MKAEKVLLAAVVFFSFVFVGAAQAATVSVMSCVEEGNTAFYSFNIGEKGCAHEIDEVSLPMGESQDIECEDDSDGGCQVAVDYVGGQWAHFKCPAIEPKEVKEDELLVVCSTKDKSNGFLVADKFAVVKKSDAGSGCAQLCK